MNVRFYPQVQEGRGVIVAALDGVPGMGLVSLFGSLGGAPQLVLSIEEARDHLARLSAAIEQAESFERSVRLTKKPDGSFGL